MSKIKSLIVSFLEYVIGTIMILGGIGTVLSGPLHANTTIMIILGSHVAVVLYGIIFIITGVLLIASKVFGRRKAHGKALMSIYLVCIFVFFLEFMFSGLSVNLIDEVVIGLLAAVFWLRWKMLTEYMDLRKFHQEAQRLRP